VLWLRWWTATDCGGERFKEGARGGPQDPVFNPARSFARWARDLRRRRARHARESVEGGADPLDPPDSDVETTIEK
jgi:hypothetical protein